MDLKELNSEQIDAVSSLEGHIRVVAGAGSGKTRALAYRVAFLVDEIGISPSNILCVTFTNKAANEMKRRIRKLIGDNDCGYVVTFHGLCVRILREDGHTIGYPKSFPILDDEDRDQILKDVYEESRLTLRDMNYKDAKRAIEMFKNGAGTQYDDYMISLSLDELYDKFKSAKNAKDKIIHGYIYYQRKMFALDFSDLILLTMYVFNTYETVLSKWQQRFQYIMVDEFQDVSTSQYEMAKLLSDYHNNLFIVRDPDQTIYSWRGAKVNYIIDFDKDYPDTKTIVLNKNYRSSPNILSVSNSLIKHNQFRYEKELIPIQSANVPVLYNHAKTTNLEADWIVEQIKYLLDSGKKLSDIAILYRAHYVARPIEEKFLQAQLPYRIYSGTPFYGRREIKDVLAYLRLLLYKDDLSFKRVFNTPKRNIGKARMKIIQDYADTNNLTMYEALVKLSNTSDFADTGTKDFLSLIEYFESAQKDLSLSDLVAQMIDKSGYEILLRTEGDQDRLDNIEELKRSIYSFETTYGEHVSLVDYLSVAALYSNDDLSQKSRLANSWFSWYNVRKYERRIIPCQHIKSQIKASPARQLLGTKRNLLQQHRSS